MSSREDVDLALCLVGTVMATRVELSPTNLSATTKDFFHSSLESKMRGGKKHLETVTLRLFDPLCRDKVQSVQPSVLSAISFVKNKANNINNALQLHENVIKCVISIFQLLRITARLWFEKIQRTLGIMGPFKNPVMNGG